MVRIEFPNDSLQNEYLFNGITKLLRVFIKMLEEMSADPEYSENGNIEEVLETLRRTEKITEPMSGGICFTISIV